MLDAFKEYIILYFTSMIPWIEQKAGIVLIANGSNFWLVFLTTSLAALTIVPLVILFTDFLIKGLKKIKKIESKATKWEEKILMQKDKIQKYELLGLFVVVVCPGTGMWTAAMLASLLRMDFFKSVFLIVFASMCVGLF